MSENMPVILIVEDEALIAMELEIELLDNGYEPLGPAASVQAAMSLLDAHSVAAAILDVRLGTEEVFPVADRLAKEAVPFVFHSGHASRSCLKDRYGARVFTKPANLSAMTTFLDQTLA